MKRKNKLLKIWNIIVILLIIGLIAYLGYYFLDKKLNLFGSSKNDNIKENDKDNKKDEEEEKEEPKLKIIDLDSKTRPIGVMIDNETGAWPQAGLQDAYLVYEVVIEWGQTRFFAIYKDKTETIVGPNRSARHYFIDYALENDAIFTHFGFSDQAKADIEKLKINDISGTQADGGVFWREAPKGSYHNVFTKIGDLMARASKKNYRVTSNQDPLLDYSIQELDISKIRDSKIANNIRINYSSSHYVTYEYDSVNKVYKRFMRGKPHVDRKTGNQYTVKNIIVYNAHNYSLNDGSGKGRQGLENIGSGTGYYITDGYAMPITWSKSSRDARTIYTDNDGNTIKINDGNTFIQIQPTNQALTMQ